jgi:hypothetical protein
MQLNSRNDIFQLLLHFPNAGGALKNLIVINPQYVADVMSSIGTMESIIRYTDNRCPFRLDVFFFLREFLLLTLFFSYLPSSVREERHYAARGSAALVDQVPHRDSPDAPRTARVIRNRVSLPNDCVWFSTEHCTSLLTAEIPAQGHCSEPRAVLAPSAAAEPRAGCRLDTARSSRYFLAHMNSSWKRMDEKEKKKEVTFLQD